VGKKSFARHLAQVINGYRQLQGLPVLEVADELQALASEHSTEMAAQRRLSHDGFQGRFGRTTSRLCVENVGWNHPSAESLLDGWRLSPLEASSPGDGSLPVQTPSPPC
jgi:uncharacterized protein YkwD